MSQKIMISGKQLQCQFCGAEEFHEQRVLLNTAGASFLGFDWANREADCFVCTKCGYIHWFHPDYSQCTKL